MKLFALSLILILSTTQASAAPIKCRAFVTYSYNDNKSINVTSQALETYSPADQSHIIMAPRESGMQLAVTFNEDFTKATDTSNFILQTSDGQNLVFDHNVPLDFSGGRFAFTHKNSEKSPEGNLFAVTFEMNCTLSPQN